MEIGLLVALIVLVLACIVMQILILTKKKETKEVITKQDFEELLDETNESINKSLVEKLEADRQSTDRVLAQHNIQNTENFKNINQTLETRINSLNTTMQEQLKGQRQETQDSVNKMQENLSQGLDKLNSITNRNLRELQEGNEKKLDQIKGVVDEKLTTQLNQKVAEAFKSINESLSNAQKSFGEIRTLTLSMDNLNKSFTGIKTRGTWGEVSLEMLLEDILVPQQYEKQFNIRGDNKVDFAIKMPGLVNGEYVYLPIDSKFPITSYINLSNAVEAQDKAKIEEYQKAFKKDVDTQAKSIASKYISVPKTTNFAIIYLPTEGIYSEVVKNNDLMEKLQEKKIIPCGPTTITALLNSLQVGFKTMQIQKKSDDIVKLFAVIKNDFIKFTEGFGKIKKNAESIVNVVDDINKKKEKIDKNFNKIESFSTDETNQIENNVEEL